MKTHVANLTTPSFGDKFIQKTKFNLFYFIFSTNLFSTDFKFSLFKKVLPADPDPMVFIAQKIFFNFYHNQSSFKNLTAQEYQFLRNTFINSSTKKMLDKMSPNYKNPEIDNLFPPVQSTPVRFLILFALFEEYFGSDKLSSLTNSLPIDVLRHSIEMNDHILFFYFHKIARLHPNAHRVITIKPDSYKKFILDNYVAEYLFDCGPQWTSFLKKYASPSTLSLMDSVSTCAEISSSLNKPIKNTPTKI